MLERVGPGTLVIVPGDREDVILTLAAAHLAGRPRRAAASARRARGRDAGRRRRGPGGQGPGHGPHRRLRAAPGGPRGGPPGRACSRPPCARTPTPSRREVHDLLVKTHAADAGKIELIKALVWEHLLDRPVPRGGQRGEVRLSTQRRDPVQPCRTVRRRRHRHLGAGLRRVLRVGRGVEPVRAGLLPEPGRRPRHDRGARGDPGRGQHRGVSGLGPGRGPARRRATADPARRRAGVRGRAAAGAGSADRAPVPGRRAAGRGHLGDGAAARRPHGRGARGRRATDMARLVPSGRSGSSSCPIAVGAVVATHGPRSLFAAFAAAGRGHRPWWSQCPSDRPAAVAGLPASGPCGRSGCSAGDRTGCTSRASVIVWTACNGAMRLLLAAAGRPGRRRRADRAGLGRQRGGGDPGHDRVRPAGRGGPGSRR